MKLTCQKCGEQVSAENINTQALVATCHCCAEVFDFSAEFEGNHSAKTSTPFFAETLLKKVTGLFQQTRMLPLMLATFLFFAFLSLVPIILYVSDVGWVRPPWLLLLIFFVAIGPTLFVSIFGSILCAFLITKQK